MNMEQKEKISFKQLPSNLDNFHVGVRDVAVYLTMRQFENWETHSTYVSCREMRAYKEYSQKVHQEPYFGRISYIDKTPRNV